MKKIRVGIIGSGFGASVHAPILKLHPGFEMTAITSVFQRRSKDFFAEIGVKSVYTNWKAMLTEEKLDLVIICSSPDQHYDMTLECLHRKIHVLCEKPLGINTVQTSKLLEVQRVSEVMGFVNFQWRLTPERKRIKEILDNGELGEIQFIKYQGSFSGYNNLSTQYRGWDGEKRKGGGLLFAVGSHMFDSLMWWMNKPITDVYADLKTVVPIFVGSEGIEKRDAEDFFAIMGRFENGTSFIADLYYPGVRGSGWNLEILGTKGTLIMKNDKDLMLSKGEEFENLKIDEPKETYQLDSPANQYVRGLHPMLDLVHKSVVNNLLYPNVPTLADGHLVQLVMEAVEESAKERMMKRVNSK